MSKKKLQQIQQRGEKRMIFFVVSIERKEKKRDN